MPDPTPQGTFPPLLGEVSDGDIVVFRRVGGALYVASGSATGPTGPSGAGRSGPTGPSGPSGAPIVTFNPADKDASFLLSNSNLTATSNTGSWTSGRAIGPFKSAGKAYFRCTISTNFLGPAFVTASAPMNNFFGAAAGQGVLAYGRPGSAITIEYHGASAGSGPVSSTSGDWIVVAMDLTTGNFWCTAQTAAGTLNTNWNAGANSPAAGTGPLATDLAGASVVPGASILSTIATTIDANTVISDATLTGFVPWAQL